MNHELSKQDVIDVINRQAANWLGRRDSVEKSTGDEIDTLVESSVMYQLLADMALQHKKLVERIK